MFPSSLLLVLLLVGPALMTSSGSKELEVKGQRSPRDTQQGSIKVVISEGCVTQGDSSDGSQGGKEMDLAPGSPLVLTTRIKLVPFGPSSSPGPGSGSGSCGCDSDLAALRERLERLEREVSALREKCAGAEGGCCSSKESKGAGCSIKPETDECPNECSDQGRCVDGRCVCFSGFSGVDCSQSDCPGNCHDNGRCVNGQCVCDPDFTGPDCSQRNCPDNCSNRGKCVNGKCVCASGFAGPSCSDESCPGNCNNRGRCVNGQCVCNPGFAAPDCKQRACPDNCNNRGRCVNGRCVCESGYTGPSCSDESCPGNCNNKGRCVNGECVCEEGFTGDDCSEKTCPNDCMDRGRCVDGRCVCESGFTGNDCSEESCPGNCNNKGRCVNGQCVCNEGFAGEDCSEKTCPSNCSNRGKCVNGRCVCEVGFAGPDCGAKGCPNNCSNKGRCMKGRCVCRRGFTGPDCSQCDEGMAGPNCDIVMSAVSRLDSRDITESSVTVFWTQPAVQYQTYYIVFTSQKEPDQQISVTVDGSRSSFTQTGLAAGQRYDVTVTGEIHGRRGPEGTTEFMTLISAPIDLQVVKTHSESAVVQWQPAQGEIDGYSLAAKPSDGEGQTQTMAVPSGESSAHIQELQPGTLYDVTLVAEKGESKSEPATTQFTTGLEPARDLVISDVTENSMKISWAKPYSPVSSFKVTYSLNQDGLEAEPVSVSVNAGDSNVGLTRLNPGSSYAINVISIRGLDESDPLRDPAVYTLPDSPTDLRAVNVTDTTALLLWRPALAAVDKYSIVYGAGTGSELRISVSGNAAEQQLSGLDGSTTYTVTITSQQGALQSKEATTSFTTTGGSGRDLDGPRDLRASDVTPRTALLSWKPPSSPPDSYKLTYHSPGQEPKEVRVDGSVSSLALKRLHPGSQYIVQLQAERDGQYTAAINTDFTTGTLRFPFPSDCSQELLNGIRTSGEVELFPHGKLGAAILAYCDMETDGGGWTVFQRRQDGSVDFFKGWKDYIKGFGDLSGEFWLGLDALHNLTTMTKMSLRVDMRDLGESVFAKYSSFEVAKRNYRLTVGGYSGTAGDSLSYHNNRLFSTKDRDPTPFITRCAMSYRGGWWYKNCHEANLNGRYGVDVKHQGVIWTSWKGKEYSVAFVEMKMRPTSFSPPTNG